MTNSPVPNHPQPPATHLRQLAFAFPFRRKAQGNAAAQFMDEHDIYRLLAASEPSGSYLASRKGMWHGGIHVTEAGAGQALDLDAGLRCIADGVLIAYRANKDYPVSELAIEGSSAPFQAAYSTGFALVRHEMEFPRGTKLTLYSLYMHLMSNADYESNFPKRQKPAYWSRQWQVTQYAQDRPSPRPGQTADPSQVGLHVRKTPNGAAVGILPQGARVTIGKTQTVHGATWGQLTDLNGATLYAPIAGDYVAASDAIDGWIYLGAQNGGPVAEESIRDSIFDRIMVTTDQTCSAGDLQGSGGGIPVKAGDLMGHLGRYDALDRSSAAARMAHIEVFCDGSIRQFIEAGRAWVDANCMNPAQWSQIGLSPEPTMLRVQNGTTLYDIAPNGGTPPQKSAAAKQTDVIQVEASAVLQKNAAGSFMETTPGNDGTTRHWWKVDGADVQRNAISGWVREQSFAGGRVTREFPQSWIDFDCHDEDHDPTHTIFATTSDYMDYALGSDTPGAGSLGTLSPLMAAIYRTLYPTGDGSHAADQLCGSGSEAQGGGFPWAAFRASRLIAKHESEWANPAKWQELVSAIEQRTGPKAEHEEENKRIAKLVWWDEVAAGVAGFPGSDVYHINPIALAANFQFSSSLITLAMLKAVEPLNSDAYYESILPYLNRYALAYQVNTPKRIAHFLSQAAHESKLRSSEEGLDYRPQKMRKTFGCKGGPGNYQSSCDDCAHGRLRDKLWSQENYYAHNPEHLANYVYANRMGNGGEESGDGYKYRGRGFIQVTGKDGYQSFQDEHNRRSPESMQDFIGNPNLVSTQLEYAVESAFVFWARVNLNSTSDAGTVAEVTQIVNGGQNGYADRLARYNAVASLLGLPTE